jgi:hypothetical protein
MRDIRNAYNIFVGKMKGKDHFGEVGVACKVVDCIQRVQFHFQCRVLVKTVMKFWVP